MGRAAHKETNMDFDAAKNLCRTFPGCTEDIKWDHDTVFSVGGKMFAVTNADGPAEGFSFKVDDGRFLELTDRPGIDPAPYLARAKWVYVSAQAQMDVAEVSALLRRSHELIFAKLTRKLQREILDAA
jgi:predicted DNA-binding protein (MmcQ/YjbR family)